MNTYIYMSLGRFIAYTVTLLCLNVMVLIGVIECHKR